jgi:hypothetical protein
MYIKVRAEEVLIGGVLGAGLGLAVAAPLATGMPSMIPSLANGLWPAVQAATAAGLAAAGALAGGWLAGHQEQDSHVHGARYFADYRAARVALQAVYRHEFSAAQKAHKVRGIVIGGVELSRRAETRGLFGHGKIGGGKTVVLTSLIDQAAARGDRLLLHDPKGDFVKRYYRDDGSVVLLGPWDARAAVWDAAGDLPDPADVDQFATAICGATEAAGQNKSFHDAAANLMAGILKARIVDGEPWSWRDLYAAMVSEPRVLVHTAVHGDPMIRSSMSAAYEGAELPNAERAALDILINAARWISSYSAVDVKDMERPRFSLRKWLKGTAHEDVRIVILNSHDRYQAACEGLFGSMLAVVAGMVDSPEMPERSRDESGIWFVGDEFPQLGLSALQSIQKLAELGRSRGLRTVVALQDESQLPGRVGREKAEPMLAMQATRVYAQTDDKSAKAIADRIGQRRINRIDTTAQGGATSGKTKRVEHEAVIGPADLTGLTLHGDPEDGVEIVMHVGSTLGRLVQPFVEQRKDEAPAIIESETWRMGSLPGWMPDAAAAAPTESLGADAGEAVATDAATDTTAEDLPEPTESNDDGGMDIF